MRQVRPPKIFEVQESARGHLSQCQVWWGSDFNRRGGSQKTLTFLPAAARSAKRGYLSHWYSDGDFEFYRPRGRHVAPMAVKFSMPNLTPIGETIRV